MAWGPFEIGSTSVEPGTRATIDLPVARLYTNSEMTIPVHVVHGKHSGPGLFVSAAMHGDEINGVEIIRRVLRMPMLKRLHGTLVAVPIVNVHGFINRSRYLPDRRDLNRSFPGSEKGSLAARVAHLFLQQIVARCTHGIDLHTAAIHRENLPQIRADLDDSETRRLATAFGVPVLLNADIRDGSLRAVASEKGIPVLLYEAGEALRFDEIAIRAGVHGVASVMRELEMLPPGRRRKQMMEPVTARSTVWVRAAQSGILRAAAPLGARVRKGDVLGTISDPFGSQETEVASAVGGIVIGRCTLPLVNEGEALYNIARFEEPGAAEAAVQSHIEQLLPSDFLTDGETPIV